MPLPSCHRLWAQRPQGAQGQGLLRDDVGGSRAHPPIRRVHAGTAPPDHCLAVLGADGSPRPRSFFRTAAPPTPLSSSCLRDLPPQASSSPGGHVCVSTLLGDSTGQVQPPKTQSQVLPPGGWRYCPAGHRPHCRHLCSKVMPPRADAVTWPAWTCRALHLPAACRVLSPCFCAGPWLSRPINCHHSQLQGHWSPSVIRQREAASGSGTPEVEPGLRWVGGVAGVCLRKDNGQLWTEAVLGAAGPQGFGPAALWACVPFRPPRLGPERPTKGVSRHRQDGSSGWGTQELEEPPPPDPVPSPTPLSSGTVLLTDRMLNQRDWEVSPLGSWQACSEPSLRAGMEGPRVAEVAASGIQGASGNGTGCPEAGEAESPPGAGAGTGPPDSVAGELSPQLGVEAQALL
ncbi:hypothetical protein AB1E18_010718 [Capra hircus]